MAGAGSGAGAKEERGDGAAAAGVTAAPAFPAPVRPGVWAKDHCDYLLDSIDAQLGRLQAQKPTAETRDDSSKETATPDGTVRVSRAADLGGSSGDGDKEASPAEDSASPMEEDHGWQAHGLDLEGNLGDQSRSDSVCTEDLVAQFQASLVDLLLSSDTEGKEDAFALAIIPCDIQLLQSQGESTSTSQPLADSQSASDLARQWGRTPSLKDVSRWTWAQDSLIPCSGQPPSPSAGHRIWSLESLGEKVSLLSQKDSNGTTNAMEALGDNLLWRKDLQPGKPLNLGEQGDSAVISGEKAFWEPVQRRKSFEASLEWVRKPHDSSSSLLHVGDLDPWLPLETDVVPVKMCALPGSQYRCFAPSGGEGRGGLIPPGLNSPLTTCRTGEMQRLALSRLKSLKDGTCAPGPSLKPPGFPSNGCPEPWKNWAAGAPHPEGHSEALEPMAYGSVEAGRRSEPTKGQKEHSRDWCLTATGCSAEVSPSPQQDLLRFLGSSDGGPEEEEDLARLCPGNNGRTSYPGKQAPSQAADASWTEALLGTYRDCKVQLSLECRDGLLTKVSQLLTEREELKVHIQLLEEQLSYLKLQLRSSKAELASVKKMAHKMKQLQEAILSEKEMELSRLWKIVSALEAEKEVQSSMVEKLKEEKASQPEGLQREAQQEKEKDLFWLLEELQQEKQQALQEFAEQTEQVKASILPEQAAGFQKEFKNLCKALEARGAELLCQKEAQQQKVNKLKQEAEEMVQNALLRKQKKGEADTWAAVQRQCEVLQEQNQRAWTDLQQSLEGEWKASLALREMMASLHTRIQKLESQVQTFPAEKKEAVEEVRAQLEKEKAEALQWLQEELEQERNQMRVKLQQMEEDQSLLRAELSKRKSQACGRWAECSLAREVAVACRQLQDLLPRKAKPILSQMLRGSPVLLPSDHLLQALREDCREIQLCLQDLKHKMEMQRHDTLQIQKEKEWGQQQESLRLERRPALEALKEQLVQEHLKGVAALQHSWLRETGAKEDLRLDQPLRRKSEEQAIETNLVCWRDQLAREFKEELSAELEKRLSRDKPMKFQRALEMPESEIQPFSKGSYFQPRPCCSRWLNAAPVSSSQCHFTTPKLLCRLQSHIQLLRTENAAYRRASLDNVHSFQEGLADANSSKSPLAVELSSSPPCGSSSWK